MRLWFGGSRQPAASAVRLRQHAGADGRAALCSSRHRTFADARQCPASQRVSSDQVKGRTLHTGLALKLARNVAQFGAPVMRLYALVAPATLWRTA